MLLAGCSTSVGPSYGARGLSEGSAPTTYPWWWWWCFRALYPSANPLLVPSARTAASVTMVRIMILVPLSVRRSRLQKGPASFGKANFATSARRPPRYFRSILPDQTGYSRHGGEPVFAAVRSGAADPAPTPALSAHIPQAMPRPALACRPPSAGSPRRGPRTYLRNRSRPAVRPTARRSPWCARCTARCRETDRHGGDARDVRPVQRAAQKPAAPPSRRVFRPRNRD